MRLKFNNSVSTVKLTEAGNVAQGKRIMYIEAIYKALAADLEKGGFKFVKGSDVTKGFYITLPQKFMYKFMFELDGDFVAISAEDYRGNAADEIDSLDVASIGEFNINEMIENMQSQLIPNINAPVSESLGESTTLVEYGPLDFIKNAINKSAAKKFDKRAQKQAELTAKDLFKQGIEKVANNFKAAVSAIGLKSSAKVGNTSAELIIMPQTSAYITVKLEINTADVNKLKVAEVLGPDGKPQEVKDTIADVEKFVTELGKLLKLNVSNSKKAIDDAAEEIFDLSEFPDFDDDEDSNDKDPITTDEITKEMQRLAGNKKLNRMTPADFKSKFKSADFTSSTDKDLRKIIELALGSESADMLDSLNQASLAKVAAELVK